MTSISRRAAICLTARRSLVEQRGTIARLHTSQLVAKSKKSTNTSASNRSNNTKKAPTANSVPLQSRPKENLSSTEQPPDSSAIEPPSVQPSSAEIPAATDVPPTDPLASQLSAASELPDAGSAQAAASSGPDRAGDSNLLNDGQFQVNRQQDMTGPFSWKAALLFIVTGVGLVVYFRHEKERMERLRITTRYGLTEGVAEENKSMGQARVGGPYKLIDFDGKEVTQDTYAGKHTLIYFGFTRCPDICPEELDKMATIIDAVNDKGRVRNIQPLFITCDPARDDPASLRKYLSEFHQEIVGLTGTYEDVKQTCKSFRVYFSTPPNVKPGQDYLVDHSIFFYLMGICAHEIIDLDPENHFVEAFGRNISHEETSKRILGHIKDWEKAHK